MSIFDDREKGFERKFGQDQEHRFKAKVLRNKLLGRWAADHLGLDATAAKAYVAELVEGELLHHGDDDLVAKVTRDFAAKGIGIDIYRVRAELARMTAAANKEFKIAT
jgi:hypothetical protein